MPINFEQLRGRAFLERTGIMATVVAPLPRYSPELSGVHTMPLEPPLPQPELLSRTAQSSEALPGEGEVQAWPHPETDS